MESTSSSSMDATPNHANRNNANLNLESAKKYSRSEINESKKLFKQESFRYFPFKRKDKKILQTNVPIKIQENDFLFEKDFVRNELRKGTDPNTALSNGMTLLTLIASMGDTQALKIILKHIENIDVADPSGRTALIIAASQGNLTTVDLLIKNGARVDGQDSNGFTALLTAVRFGHVEIVKLLLENGAEPIFSEYQWSRNALGWAATNGNIKIVRLLLESCGVVFKNNSKNKLSFKYKNYDAAKIYRLIISQDINENSAFMLAIQYQHEDVAILLTEILLEFIEIDCMRNEIGHTPLTLAVSNGLINYVKFLIKRKSGNISQRYVIDLAGYGKEGVTALCIAIEKKDDAMINLLIDEGARSSNLMLRRELVLAAKNSSLKTVKRIFLNSLVTYEELCDSFEKSFFFTELLYNAAAAGSLEVVEFFLNPESVVPYIKKMDLKYSSFLKHPVFLINSGTDFWNECKQASIKTALEEALKNNQIKTVDLLIDKYGAEIELKPNPLIFFARQKNIEMICYLLKKGIRLSERECTKLAAEIFDEKNPDRQSVVILDLLEPKQLSGSTPLHSTDIALNKTLSGLVYPTEEITQADGMKAKKDRLSQAQRDMIFGILLSQLLLNFDKEIYKDLPQEFSDYLNERALRQVNRIKNQANRLIDKKVGKFKGILDNIGRYIKDAQIDGEKLFKHLTEKVGIDNFYSLIIIDAVKNTLAAFMGAQEKSKSSYLKEYLELNVDKENKNSLKEYFKSHFAKKYLEVVNGNTMAMSQLMRSESIPLPFVKASLETSGIIQDAISEWTQLINDKSSSQINLAR